MKGTNGAPGVYVQFGTEWWRRLTPNRESPLPKVRQLYLALYQAITAGDLPFATRLPASRALATKIGVGRNTVVAVYRQLADDGLVEADGRYGTQVLYRAVRADAPVVAVPQPARRTQALTVERNHFTDFAPGVPDASLFPAAAWRHALKCAAALPASELGYRRQPLERLQLALARYLATWRSLHVAPEQIVITASTRQSLLLAAALYAEPGDVAWVESPGYAGAVEAFRLQGLLVKPADVDGEGVRWSRDASSPRLIYTTPCFQYPSGATLSAARRKRLLQYANSIDAVVFEDDYDSEFRDEAQARPALAASGNAVRVLHAGTFSKLIFPGVRLAWLVVPDAQVDTAAAVLRALGGGHNSVAQAAVGELLDNGAIVRHLRRARQVYAGRRERVLDCLRRNSVFRCRSGQGGSLSLVVPLTSAVPFERLESALIERRLGARPLERFCWQNRLPDEVNALVLGLGNVDALGIPRAVRRLTAAVIQAGDLTC